MQLAYRVATCPFGQEKDLLRKNVDQCRSDRCLLQPITETYFAQLQSSRILRDEIGTMYACYVDLADL